MPWYKTAYINANEAIWYSPGLIKYIKQVVQVINGFLIFS